jgi:ammonia channel protein AmtB
MGTIIKNAIRERMRRKEAYVVLAIALFLLFFCAAHPVWTDCFWHLPAQKSYPRLESTFPG